MILRKYGVELRSMQEDDLERVRSWRNAPHVKVNMRYQEEITAESHKQWFSKLGDDNLYFVITYKSKSIGVLHVKAIDWAKRTGEAGVFIGDKDYLGTMIPMLAVFNMMDNFFEQFNFEMLLATVLKSNEEAIHFNRSLGYQIIEDHESFYALSVRKDDYLLARKSFDKFLNKFYSKDEVNELSEDEKLLVNITSF